MRLHRRDAPLGEVGKLQVVEKEIEKLVAGQHEAEIVLALPVVATGCAAASAGRPVDRVAFDETLVAGQDVIVHAAFAGPPEAGFADTVGRDRDLSSPFEIGDVPITRGLAYGPLNLRFGPAQKALAIGQTLAPWVKAPVDDVHRNA